MERESYLPVFLFLSLVTALTFFSVPCLAKDSAASSKLKFGVRFYPITPALVEKPMDISFHGRSSRTQGEILSNPLESPRKKDSNTMEIISQRKVSTPSASIKFNDHLGRIHSYLFQYIRITPCPSQLDIKQGYSLGTRTEKQKDRIAVEILADPFDLSGGLVFIMPI